MVTPDFYVQQNRKSKCKICGVERNFKAFNHGLCKDCEKTAKNQGLGSFDK
jgi:hypothetical protein